VPDFWESLTHVQLSHADSLTELHQQKLLGHPDGVPISFLGSGIGIFRDKERLTFTVDSKSYKSSVSSPWTPSEEVRVPYSDPCSTALPAMTLLYKGTSNARATNSIASCPTV
jgi:hypothetical protein